jgi:predicted regulator of Ras-like GTPase activity (Roadblock/LC7/MglB family)
MPFLSILKELVNRTPRAVGAILIDWEGEAVQEYCHCTPYDIRFMAAHQAIILNRFRECASWNGGARRIQDFVITTDRAHLIIGCVDDDYSLMMNVERDCPLQLALRHFRHAVAELKKEI